MLQHSSISALTDHLGYWMRMVSNNVSHAFARKLAGQDITVAEWVLLRQMYNTEALAPSQLAAQLGLTRGAISKLAERLMDKRLITRTESPDDGRAHTLSLTGNGKRVVPQLARLADDNDAEFFKSLTREERQQLASILKKIATHHNLKNIPVN